MKSFIYYKSRQTGFPFASLTGCRPSQKETLEGLPLNGFAEGKTTSSPCFCRQGSVARDNLNHNQGIYPPASGGRRHFLGHFVLGR
jgi:hypothetical protein